MNQSFRRIADDNLSCRTVDFDEFIVIHRASWTHRTLASIFDEQFAQRPNVGALLIRNSFFWREWDCGDNISDSSGLVLVDKMWRSAYIFPARKRSKLAIWTSDVDVLGNHFVWRFKKKAQSARNRHATFGEQELLLHHYRTLQGKNNTAAYRNGRDKRVRDTFALSIGWRLANELVTSPAVKCLNFTV